MGENKSRYHFYVNFTDNIRYLYIDLFSAILIHYSSPSSRNLTSFVWWTGQSFYMVLENLNSLIKRIFKDWNSSQFKSEYSGCSMTSQPSCNNFWWVCKAVSLEFSWQKTFLIGQFQIFIGLLPVIDLIKNRTCVNSMPDFAESAHNSQWPLRYSAFTSFECRPAFHFP